MSENNDIAKRAGISAAAIYRYFPSRDDVFVEALVRHMKIVEELFEKKVAQGRTNLEELAMHIRATRNTGVAREEVKEVLLQVAVYAGIPAANAAIGIAKRVFAEMEEDG